MACRMMLVTNNPKFSSLSGVSVEFISVSALDIVKFARDRIHKGWKLLNHPLYGNYRPYQQPFRTLLLEQQSPDSVPWGVDEYSLSLIESALNVYESCEKRMLVPGMLPSRAEADCSLMDADLMRETLLKSGIDIR